MRIENSSPRWYKRSSPPSPTSALSRSFQGIIRGVYHDPRASAHRARRRLLEHARDFPELLERADHAFERTEFELDAVVDRDRLARRQLNSGDLGAVLAAGVGQEQLALRVVLEPRVQLG